MRLRSVFIVALLSYICAVATPLAAQEQNREDCRVGVYSSSEQYKRNEATYGTEIVWGIHAANWGPEKVLKLKVGDSIIYKYRAGRAFAYTEDCDLFRYYAKDDIYVKQLTTEGLILYSKVKVSHIRPGLPGIKDTHLYFSKDVCSPLFELTKKNLISEFADQQQFVSKVNELNIDFLTRIDKVTNEYNIVRIYNEYIGGR